MGVIENPSPGDPAPTHRFPTMPRSTSTPPGPPDHVRRVVRERLEANGRESVEARADLDVKREMFTQAQHRMDALTQERDQLRAWLELNT